MSNSKKHRVTEILQGLHAAGVDSQAVADSLFSLIYDELRHLASDLMNSERADHTLQATALVHEAYLRLVDDTQMEWQNRAHFFGTAARAMRQILVDHARRRAAIKRGGGLQRVTLDSNLELQIDHDVQILDLEDALTRFAEMDERAMRVVELRIFGGLTVEETAHVLDLSERTVYEDWRVARMWLARDLARRDRGSGRGPSGVIPGTSSP